MKHQAGLVLLIVAALPSCFAPGPRDAESWQVEGLRAALTDPYPEVRKHALSEIRELAEPFRSEIRDLGLADAIRPRESTYDERGRLGKQSDLLATFEKLTLLGANDSQIAEVRELVDSPDAFVASLALEIYCEWGEPLGFDDWAEAFERGLDLKIAAAGCWRFIAQLESREQELWLQRQLALLREPGMTDIHDAVLLSLGKVSPDLRRGAAERLQAAVAGSTIADNARELAVEALARIDLSRLPVADLRAKLEEVDFLNALVEKRRKARSWLGADEFRALASVGQEPATLSRAFLLLVDSLDEPDNPDVGNRCMSSEMCADLVARAVSTEELESAFQSAVSILVNASTVTAAQMLDKGLVDSIVASAVRVDQSLMRRLALRIWREEPEATASRVDSWATLAAEGQRESASREKAIVVLSADPAAADQERSRLTEIAGAIDERDSLKAVAITALGSTRSFQGDHEGLREHFDRLRDDQIESKVAVLDLFARRDALSEAEFRLVISQLSSEKIPVAKAAERVLREAAPLPTEAVFCLLVETYARDNSRWLNRFLAHRLSGNSLRADYLIALFGLDEGELRRPIASLAKDQDAEAEVAMLLAALVSTAGNKRLGVRTLFARTFEALVTTETLRNESVAKAVRESLPSIRRVDEGLFESMITRLDEAAREAKRRASGWKWAQRVGYPALFLVASWFVLWLVLRYPKSSLWIKKLLPSFEARVREGRIPLHVLRDRKIRGEILPATLGHEPLPEPEAIERLRDGALVRRIAGLEGPRLVKARGDHDEELRVAGALIREQPDRSAVIVDGGRLTQNLWPEVASFLRFPWEVEKYARELVLQGDLAIIISHAEKLAEDVRGSVWKTVLELKEDSRAIVVVVWANDVALPVEFQAMRSEEI